MIDTLYKYYNLEQFVCRSLRWNREEKLVIPPSIHIVYCGDVFVEDSEIDILEDAELDIM